MFLAVLNPTETSLHHSRTLSFIWFLENPKFLREPAAGLGKSSLTIQFVEGQFVDSYDPTIENTFTKTMTVNGQEYNLQLVDTAGQDEYSIFPESYTIDVNGYVLIYSVTSYK
ncbi:hypothetical protein CHARACLAT_023423, partial [Characodon lateralis]|nr:hypothetical protein [Characodon lateralis]